MVEVLERMMRKIKLTAQRAMLCGRPGKRKLADADMLIGPPFRGGLMSPLKSLKLSPIPRNDEKYDIFSSREGLLQSKENIRWQCARDSAGSHRPEPDGASGRDLVPVLEISEKERVGLGEKPVKMYQPYKGQVKLSVYVNYGLLTIHVVQARHLNATSRETCDSFVKLSLAPDESRRTRCKTELIHDTNHPVYDEKFSFELLDEDMKKRLLISVWHRDAKKGRSEFLGCMSFGIQHISTQKRVINGWYYLLTEEVGRKKHLQVSTKKPTITEIGHKNIPKVNQDILWMEPHVLLIRRGPIGFGFSLTGCSPVRVCNVVPGSLAEEAGLLKDDCIVRVNGMNVSRSSADSIARIVRHSARKIVLEIQRAQRVEPLGRSPRKPLSSTLRHPHRHHHHPDSGAHSDSELEENVRNKLTIGMCGTLPRKRVTFKDNAC